MVSSYLWACLIFSFSYLLILGLTNLLFVVSFCETLERRESAEIPVVKERHILSIDCTVPTRRNRPCIEYRDNATSMPRWLGVFVEDGQFYSLFKECLLSVYRIIYRFLFFVILSLNILD